MKINFLKSSIISGLTLVIGLASCSKDNKNSSYSPQSQNSTAAVGVQLINNVKLGDILTDKTGRTLYSFAADSTTAAQSSCNGDCAVKWPPFYDANPALGTGLNNADFGVITRNDNTKQTTYKGWPLYYYSGDTKKGDTNGDGILKAWFVSTPVYKVMFAM
ncbi:putative lipoprotein with Yx(FWY)xxD motif [Pedobacter cryoconitis]|uniref:Putative lipoprotein with Yx(FWY)xxD motif n=1 Tax=Pedobacter cryoconitis TaxID=188932 RepID=A0A7W9DXK9_9SPHI|nr:hypothetical protein [Pedobacter cryoconitis]MBB5635033.1 putative lipoprotein with Yx(FWY)xxD motif [Pedobacter cryoconitis]